MNKQFFYTRKEIIPPKASDAAGAEPKIKEYKDSFNLSNVLRTVVLEDDRRLILLNDIHERLQEVPMYNKKRELTGYKKERITAQSEIYLLPEDSERFIKNFE